MPANYKAELVAVLGQPVAENPTVVMQEAAFAAAGLNWRYLTIEVPPGKLADAMTGVRAFGMRGRQPDHPAQGGGDAVSGRDLARGGHHRRREHGAL
jgi:shikimate dehydrogenase